MITLYFLFTYRVKGFVWFSWYFVLYILYGQTLNMFLIFDFIIILSKRTATALSHQIFPWSYKWGMVDLIIWIFIWTTFKDQSLCSLALCWLWWLGRCYIFQQMMLSFTQFTVWVFGEEKLNSSFKANIRDGAIIQDS